MAKLPQISESEFEIMKILWDSHPLSTNDICTRLEPLKGWNSKTIHTLLTRLYHKEAVCYEKKGRMFYYSPLVSKKDYVSHETHSFLDRFYNGNLAPLLSSFVSEKDVSAEELKELSLIIKSRLQEEEPS